MSRKPIGWGSFFLVACLCASVGFAYEVNEVVHGGTVAGRIGFTGTPPAPRHFEVQKGPEVCGPERTLTKVDVRNGWLKGAVVVLEGVKQGKSFEPQQIKDMTPGEGEFRYSGGDLLHLNVDLEKCSFGPFTGVVMADTPVQFANHDLIKHTLHTYVLKGRNATILKTVHNQNLPPESRTEKIFYSKTLNREGAIALTCDRHDFMENWLYVVDSPYFAISDRDGKFSMDQVPPGEYDLVVWHPVLGMQTQVVQIDAGGQIKADFTFAK